MKLINILKRNFIFPLTIELLLAIIISVLTSIIFSDSYKNTSLQNYLRQIEEKKVKPLIETSQEIIFTKYQNIITILAILASKYISLKNLNTAQNEPQTLNEDIFWNALEIKKRFSEIQKDNYYKTGMWFKSPSEDEFKKLGKEEKFFLNNFEKMIPDFRASYMLHHEKPSHSCNFFYMVYPMGEILASYPILDDEKFYNLFSDYENQKSFCKNKAGENPNYFYYPCRDWFLQLTEFISKDENKNKKVFISYPYSLENSKEKDEGITICYIIQNGSSQSTEGSIYLCADIWYQDKLISSFDTFNKHLTGYFYIIPTNSEYPIYYPGDQQKNYLTDITRLEFPTLKDHYVSEVSYFRKNVVSALTKTYKKEEDIISISQMPSVFDSTFNGAVKSPQVSSYTKGGDVFSFFIFPIFFQVASSANNDEGVWKEEHLLSLIYVVNSTGLEEGNGDYSFSIGYLAIEYGLLFIVIGIILVTVFGQLILIFGKNITRPIKDIQNRITSNSNKFFENNSNLSSSLLNSKNEKSDTKYGTQKGSFSMKQDDQNGSLNTREEEDKENLIVEEEEEEIIPIKNQEISSKFDLILSLKKVFLFLENPQSTFNSSLIVNFLSSNEVFNEIQNTLGKEVCLSNIGNLSSLCKKYDKAISFLSDSISITEAEEKECEKKVFESNLERYLKKDRASSMIRMTTIRRGGFQNLKGSSKFEFSRFVKLFFAFRKFFSTVKKKEHQLNQIISLTKSETSPLYKSFKDSFLYYNDYFVNFEQYRAKSFRKYIRLCIQKLISAQDVVKKDEKIFYCLLELFHFEINQLKIKTKIAVNETIELNNTEKVKDENSEMLFIEIDKKKEEVKIKKEIELEIGECIHVHKMTKNLRDKLEKQFKKNPQSQYKNFLYEIHHLKQKANSVHLNYLLLNQHFNYLIAKLSKFCGDYSKAIEYYLKVADNSILISNGVEYKKANTKIIDILDYSKRHPDILSLSTEYDEELAEFLIEKCEDNLKALNCTSKEVAIILDISPIKSGNKKVQLQQMKIIKHIFENYISTDDSFSFYIFDYKSHISKIVPLTKKDEQNYTFILNIFDNIFSTGKNSIGNETKVVETIGEKEEVGSNQNPEENSKLKENSEFSESKSEISIYEDMKMKFAIDSILYVLSELCDRKTNAQRFIITFTESFQSSENSNVNEESISELFKERERKTDVRLIIIGNLMAEQEKLSLAREKFESFFFSNDYFEYENYQEIKKLMTIIGKLPREYEFQNEKFDNK